ncbi:hypothetical protein [Halorubrum amylolyticum]|uniref:hypothetical protein n=1 Tax=Halorubrum amylolyticum TaxID=2508724 RepID=UPI001008E991|nr:hypothetical protein [Halorubrum amylolyticum]
MQTGTTPARCIATEPASDRSAPPTGPCRTATMASVAATVTPPATDRSGVGGPDAADDAADAGAEVAA